ncbi:MAG: urease subunit gamma [Janthinobacterium lividum]
MKLTPRDSDRLTVFLVAELARKRRARGVKLGHPEAVAYICDEVHEAARDGGSYDEVCAHGASCLSADDVMTGVPEMVPIVHVEVMFADGTKLVTLRNPIR